MNVSALSRKLVSLFLVFLFSLVPLLWFRPGGLITGTDVDFPLFPQERLAERSYTWYPQILAGTDRSNNITSLFFVLPQAVLSKLGFSIITVEKLTYVFWFFLTGLSFYFLARIAFPKNNISSRLSRFIGVLIYQFNFYNVFLWLRLQGAVTTMVLFPIFLGLLISVLNRKLSLAKSLLLLSIVSIFCGQTGVQPPLVFILFLTVFLYVICFLFFNFENGIKFLLVSIMKTFIMVLTFVVSSAYWVFPLFSFVSQSGYLVASTGKAVYSVGSLLNWVNSITSFLNVFRLYGDVAWFDSWGGQRYFPEFKLFQENPFLILISFIFPALVIYSILRIKKRKDWLFIFFGFVSVLGLFFSKGIHQPFGSAYSWLINNFPFFWIQRAPWQKFTIMTIVGYSVLGGFALGDIYRRLRSRFQTSSLPKKFFGRNYLAIFFGVLAIIFILGYNYLFVFGKMFSSSKGEVGYHEKYNLGFNQKFPSYLFEARNWVNGQNTDFRILLLPDDNTNVYNWGYAGSTDITSYLFNHGTLSQQYGEGFAPPSSIESLNNLVVDSIYNNKNLKIERILALLNMNYVLQRNDFRYDFYGDTDSPEFIKEKLSQQVGLRLEKTFGEWDFYKIDDQYFLPHFYIPRELSYVDGNIGILENALGQSNSEARLGVFFANQNIKKAFAMGNENEILIEGEPKNKIQEGELEMNLSQGPFPFVSRKPATFIYRFARLKEKFDKWKVRNDMESLFDKYLFYANKRISEVIKFGPGELTLNDYQKEMASALAILKDLGQKQNENFPKLLAKFEGNLWTQQKKMQEIGNFGQWRLAFEDLIKEVDKLKNQRDFSKLTYRMEIPKKGNYELLVKMDGGNSNDWQKIEERYFTKGIQEVTLPFPGISENLVDEELRIKDYLPNSIYHIGFGYQAPKGASFYIDEGGNGRKIEASLLPTGEELRYFEMFFRSSAQVDQPTIHLSLSISREKNLGIERIYQPEAVLRSVNLQTSNSKPQTPRITFIKINPTKYRVMVEGVTEPYHLIFSESFHQGWKACIQTSNIKPQAYGNEVASYFGGEIKEGTHQNTFLDGQTFETLSLKQISEDRHLLVNGYANSWYITPEDSVGKQDYEIIVEFAPQKLFYLGLVVSGLTLIGCFSYLIFDFVRRRKVVE